MQSTTYHPNKRRRIKTHGFLARSKDRDGQAVLARRRSKGRHSLTVSDEGKKYISHHHAPFKRKAKRQTQNQSVTQKGKKA